MRFVQYITRFFSRQDSIVQIALAWSNALRGAGHEVVIVHGSTDVLETAVGDGIEVRYVMHAGAGRTLVPLQFGKALSPGDVLILHTDWRVANHVAAAAARRRDVPYIVVPHGGYWPDQLRLVTTLPRPRMIAERQLLRRAAAVHVFWPTERAAIERFAGPVPFIVAPSGFDAPPGWEWKGGGGYLSWLGRYVIDCKGLDLLVAAIAELPNGNRPQVRLHGMGFPEERATLQRMVDGLDLGGSISVGDVVFGEQKREFLAAADAYIHPSRWEAHSVSLLENLAMGVPCVVTRTNHIAGSLEEHDAAVVVDPDVESIRQGIEKMAGLDAVGMGARARAYVRGRLAWDSVIAEFLTGVRTVLR